MTALAPEKKALLFKQLATKTAYEVGIEFGFDKTRKTAGSVASAVHKIYNEVKNNPEKFALSQDAVDVVTIAVSSRSAIGRSGKAHTTLREKIDANKSKTIEELALDNRSKAWQLLSLRLDDALSSRRKREKISLGEIAKVAGITFDKGQLIEGKATEHVATMAKIEGDINPGQAIDLILKMREYNNAVQEKDKKNG
jgi:hypothetical protein